MTAAASLISDGSHKQRPFGPVRSLKMTDSVANFNVSEKNTNHTLYSVCVYIYIYTHTDPSIHLYVYKRPLEARN